MPEALLIVMIIVIGIIAFFSNFISFLQWVEPGHNDIKSAYIIAVITVPLIIALTIWLKLAQDREWVTIKTNARPVFVENNAVIEVNGRLVNINREFGINVGPEDLVKVYQKEKWKYGIFLNQQKYKVEIIK